MTKATLITGGAGTLGRAVVKGLLKSADDSKIIIYSRDEAAQARMAQEPEFRSSRLEFVVGDILSKDALTRTMIRYGVSHIIHAAAQKHVPVAEKTPSQCIDINVIGSRNVLQVATEQKVKRVVMVSTDKAAQPSNVYGLSKALMERMSLEFNGLNDMSVNIARFGNLMGSRGSVLELFLKQIKNGGVVSLTDPNMTRFFIRIKTAANVVLFALDAPVNGHIFIPQMRAVKMKDFVDAAFEFSNVTPKIKVIGPRPGEKTHEYIVGDDEWIRTKSVNNFQGIAIVPLPQTKPVQAGAQTSQNAQFMQTDEIVGMIREVAHAEELV